MPETNKEIILMRHGKPAFTGAKKMASGEMPEWVRQYDLSDTGDARPTESSRELARRAQVIISSDLPRAVSSLKALGYEPMMRNNLFREAELPLYRIPGMRLSPFYWSAFFRLLWLCGLSARAEPLRNTNKRAGQAAEILINLAAEHNGPVLLMAHGVINRLIARQLKRQGWKAQHRAGQGYWEASIYRLP